MSVIMDFITLLYSLPRNHSAIFDVKATIIYASINLAKQIDDPNSCEVESLLLKKISISQYLYENMHITLILSTLIILLRSKFEIH